MGTLKLTIQQNGSSNLKTTMVLDGVQIGFEFFYNGFSDRWQMNLLNPQTLDPFLSGLGLTLGTDLLGPYRYLGDQNLIPPGPLWVLDIEGLGNDPTKDSFLEGRSALLYQTQNS